MTPDHAKRGAVPQPGRPPQLSPASQRATPAQTADADKWIVLATAFRMAAF